MTPGGAVDDRATGKERGHGSFKKDWAATHGVVRVAVVVAGAVETHIAGCKRPYVKQEDKLGNTP